MDLFSYQLGRNSSGGSGGGSSFMLPTFNLQATAEEKTAVMQQIYQNYADGKDPNFYAMGLSGQSPNGFDTYNSSAVATLREIQTPAQTGNDKYCLKYKAFDMTGGTTWDRGLVWTLLKNVCFYIYFDDNGYSSWDIWYEDECYGLQSNDLYGYFSNINGFDYTKTQVLKNIEGNLTWVDE